MENIVALVTPFCSDMSVDVAKLKELVRYHIEKKTDKILILGTTSESPTLSEDEKKLVIKTVCEEALNKISVIGGVSGNSLTSVSKEISLYDGYDIDELLVITPYYNKSSKEGIYDYFKTISAMTDKKIIIYDVPSRTNNPIDLDVLKRLSFIPNVRGIKEASSDYLRILEVSALRNDKFKIYCGDDIALPMFLVLGCDGVISVMSNVISEIITKIISSYDNGEALESMSLFNEYKNLIKSVFLDVNPIGIKFLMEVKGMGVGKLRLPLTWPTKIHQGEILKSLRS